MTDSHSSELKEAIGRARRHAPFLAVLLEREAQLAEQLEPSLADPLGAARAISTYWSEPQRLRIERRRLALLVAIGDLAGQFDLSRVTRLLSDFADDAFDRAIRTAIGERTPDVEPRGFAGIALGKLGSRELNYSSDIDPILIFDPQTLPCRPREEPSEAAVRIARRPARGTAGGGGGSRPPGSRAAPGARRRGLCLPSRSAAAALARSHADRATGEGGDLLL